MTENEIVTFEKFMELLIGNIDVRVFKQFGGLVLNDAPRDQLPYFPHLLPSVSQGYTIACVQTFSSSTIKSLAFCSSRCVLLALQPISLSQPILNASSGNVKLDRG